MVLRPKKKAYTYRPRRVETEIKLFRNRGVILGGRTMNANITQEQLQAILKGMAEQKTVGDPESGLNGYTPEPEQNSGQR